MSSEVSWRGHPLPRGRHKLAGEVVRSSQRERLLRAMIEEVGANGYARTTVPAVVATARVSRNAFYELFEDKAACFLAAMEASATTLLTELMALRSEPDWLEAISIGMERYLRWWEAHPARARAFFIGLPQVGERGIQLREQIFSAYAAMFEELAQRARAEQPELPRLPKLMARALVYATTEIVVDEVQAGRIASLPSLADAMLEMQVTALSDYATAARLLARRRRRSSRRPAA